MRLVPRPAPILAFTVIDCLEDLDAIQAEWEALQAGHARTDQLFQTFAWVRHWCRHFLGDRSHGPRKGLHIVTGRMDGSLVLVMPLIRVAQRGTIQLEWLGSPVSQYGDMLVASDRDTADHIHAALDHVSQTPGIDLISLRRVRATSPLADALTSRAPSVTAGDIAPAIALPEGVSFETFQTRYPTKALKNRRRHMRRLEEQGPITFDVVTDGDEARALIQQALTCKRAWLNARGLFSIAFSDPRLDAFFRDTPDAFAPTSRNSCGLYVFALKCDGRPIAINVAFRCVTRVLTHIAAYDLDYERFSPGSLLFEKSIAHSLETGVTVFDLMSPGDAYKLDWTDTVVPVHDYAWGLTARGRAYEALYIRRLRPAMKHAATSVPRLVRPLTRFLNL